jgi:small-conductance mechanosensitive channel
MNFSFLRPLTTGLPQLIVAIAVVLVVTAGALILFQILRSILRRVVRAEYPLLSSLLARANSLLRFALVLLALAIVTPALPLAAGTTGSMNRILVAAFVILLGWIAILASDLSIERYIRRFRIDTDDNLLARKAVTQMRVLKRTAEVLIILLTAGFALMSFDSVRQYGVSLFASAGVAGLAVGLAAKPLLGNLIAGVQIALTQPIRIDDAVVVENEWGWIEEFTSTYVVIRLWDWRRLVVPLGYFLENPFQNWTRTTASIIGSAFFHLDHCTPVAALRSKLEQIVKASKNWDGRVISLQVTDTTERTIEIRALMSARNSSLAFDLRCEVRELMLEFLQKEYPQSLPRLRTDAFCGTTERTE